MRRLSLAVTALALTLTFAATGAAHAASPRHFPRGGTEAGAAAPDLERGAFRLRFGLFEPRGDSEFWDDNAEVFTGKPEDFRDVNFGADALWSVNRHVSLMVSFDYYEGEEDQAYVFDGFEDLVHRTTLTVTPLSVGFVVYPAGRNLGVVPYLGAGGALYFWEYTEVGDFYDFVNEEDILGVAYGTDDVAAGYWLLAGLEVPVRPTWSVFFEGRWNSAKGDLGADFEPATRLDLSGTTLSAGLAWKF